MPDTLGMFLQSLQDSGQMELARQSAARQQQELELQQQKEKNAGQIDLATLLSQGATPVHNGQIQAPAPQGTLMRGDNGSIQPTLNLNGPMTSMAADPSRGTVSMGGQQLQIESPDERAASDTAQAVSRATSLNKVGKVPLTKEGEATLHGIFREGTLFDPAHAAVLGQIAQADAAQKRAEAAQERADAYQAKVENQQYGPTNLITGKGEPIVWDRKAGKFTIQSDISGLMRPGQENAQKARQLTAYEQWQIGQKKKGDADKLAFTSALNDVLAQAGGDPKKGIEVLKRTAVQDPTSPHRRYFAPLLKDLDALQGKPSETQALMDFLNENGHGPSQSGEQPRQPIAQPRQPAQVSPQPSVRPAPNVRTIAPPNSAGASTGSTQATAGPKTATLDDIGAYAAATGISRAEATRRFGAKGYEITNAPGR
jgi:hypothetical protein